MSQTLRGRTALPSYRGMKCVNDGTTLSLEDPALVEHLNVAGDAQREGDFERADEILRHVIAKHDLAKLPIDVLCPLTIRSWNVMRDDIQNENIIATVADLVKCRLADVCWYNFGEVSRALLGARMRELGLNLAEQLDYAWIKLPKRHKQHDRFLLLPLFFVDSVALRYEAPGGWRYRDGRKQPYQQRPMNFCCSLHGVFEAVAPRDGRAPCPTCGEISPWVPSF